MNASCRSCGVELATAGDEPGCPACLLRMGLMGLEGPPETSATGPRPGERVDGWLLVEILRRGPAATVFRAESPVDGRPVVLKFLASALMQDEVAYQRFVLESNRRIHHRHVVPVLSAGLHGGVPYLVVPFYSGGTLSDWIHRTWKDRQDPGDKGSLDLDFRQIARWMRDAAAAVGHLHEQGIIHRDLKPSNLLLDDEGCVRVGDFGISRSPVAAGVGLTPSGVVLGTPGFMSPEWVSGRDIAGSVSADIFGLGAILLNLLTGAPPYSGRNILETLREAVESPIPAPSSRNRCIPRDLDTICRKCLSRDPENRYRTAAEVEEDLGRFLSGDSPLALAPTAWGQLVDWGRRHRFLAGALGAGAVALGLVAVVSLVALERVAEARDASRELAEERRRQTVRLWAERGVDAMARHRLGESLAWLGAALQSETAARARGPEAAAHAASFEMARTQMPEPSQVVSLPPSIAHLWSPPGSGRMVAFDDGGSLSHWSLSDRDPAVTTLPGDQALLRFFPNGDVLLAHGRGMSNLDHLHWIGAPPEGRTLTLPLPAHLSDAALSPDRRWIAAALEDASPRIEIIEVAEAAGPSRFRWVGPLAGHTDRIRRVAWVGNDRLVSASWDGSVRLWDRSLRREIASWQTGEYLRDLAVDPLGRWLAFGGDDRRLHVVDLHTLAETHQRVYPSWVMRLAPALDGSLVVAGDRGGNVCAWDPMDGRQRMKWTRLSNSEVRRLLLSPDGTRLAIGGNDQTLRVVSVSEDASVVATLPVADERVSCAWIAEDTLATVPFDGVGMVWRIPAVHPFQPSWTIPSDSVVRAVSRDGRRITVASSQDAVVFDAADPLRPPLSRPLPGAVAGLEFSPDSRRLLVASRRGLLQAIDLDGADPGPASSVSSSAAVPAPSPVANHGLRLAEAVLEPSGDRWLAVTDDARLASLPVRGSPSSSSPIAGDLTMTGARLQTPPIAAQLVGSPDGQRFAAVVAPSHHRMATSEQKPCLWLGRFPHEPASERALEMPGICSSAAFSPDSSRIAAGSWDGRFRVFRAADGAPIGAPIQQEGPILGLTFDATGAILITGSTDRHIRFWDATTGRRVAPDIELQASVALVRITASGDLVGISNDGSVGLWAGGSWTPMSLRAPIDEPLRRFVMARDASLLAISTKDRQLTALRLDRNTVSPADAARWVDLLAPYRLSPDGQHEAITPDQRLAAWRRLAR
jgi:WD40 repeat protein